MFRRRHPLERQAEDIALQLQAKLTRMGFTHRVRYHDYDELHEVEFSEVEASPDAIRLRLDVDYLPQGVTTARLRDSVVLEDLTHALGHTVTFEARERNKGCWFVVHLGERDGIPRLVRFRDFVESYPERPSPMTIPIGYGQTGPIWRDLRQLPHLLIAGATGKGKSVMVHAILATLLHLPPHRLRVVLCDLKGGMTLGKYKRIPHLDRSHYVRRAMELPPVLAAVQAEMQRRAEAMEHVAEDIDEWNATRKQQWPYILVIIEELANAMLSKERITLHGKAEPVSRATERLLADLAARARATGIHIVATTQSPRSDVINGIIKANFPARIAFGTASDMDSRVIIDDSRAQGLPPGRMIFLDCADYYEAQAPLLSEEERAIILRKTLAGEHWLMAQSKEQRLIRDIRLILEMAERDSAGILDVDDLLRTPEIKRARLSRDRILECIAVMVRDRVAIKRSFRRTYRTAVSGRTWRNMYQPRELVLEHQEAPETACVEGEIITVRTGSEPAQHYLLPAPNAELVLKHQEASEPVLIELIRQWSQMGYTRNQMVARMGMERAKALRLIASVLGPGRV